MRESGHLAVAFQTFMLNMNGKDVLTREKLCTKLSQMESSCHETSKDADMFILNNVGTNSFVGQFYDLLDSSISVKIEKTLLNKLYCL